jgi:hypothetical protein
LIPLLSYVAQRKRSHLKHVLTSRLPPFPPLLASHPVFAAVTGIPAMAIAVALVIVARDAFLEHAGRGRENQLLRRKGGKGEKETTNRVSAL